MKLQFNYGSPYYKDEVLFSRSVIGIQGLELESVKKNSDSFRFRFLTTYIVGRIIAFRFKSVSDATLF